jgi:hypothetical protein
MATFSFNVSIDALAEIIDAICELDGYQALINGEANPESRNAFARRMLIEDLKRRVMMYRQRVALSLVSTADPDIT